MNFKKAGLSLELLIGKQFNINEKNSVSLELMANIDNISKEVKDQGSKIKFTNDKFIGIGSRYAYAFNSFKVYAGGYVGTQFIKTNFVIADNEMLYGDKSTKNVLTSIVFVGSEIMLSKSFSAYATASYSLPLSNTDVKYQEDVIFSNVKSNTFSLKIGSRYFF